MTPPIYSTLSWLGVRLNTSSEALLLLLVFGVLNILLPLILGLPIAWFGRALAGTKEAAAHFFQQTYTGAGANWFCHLAGPLWLSFRHRGAVDYPCLAEFLAGSRHYA